MSYSWRSILKGLDLLKKGIVWRVGNGESIKVWEDPWLPCGTTRRPITPRRGILISRVAELIDPITESWDVGLVESIFWPEDVPKILAIPVHAGMEDAIAWHYDSKGIFSVKSAYRVLCDDQNRRSRYDSAASSSKDGAKSKKVWGRIWDMEAPSRLKHFLWHLAHNSLALRVNLKHRGVKVEDDRCFLCHRDGEDGGHLFFKCKQVRAIWRSAGMEAVRVSLAECSNAKAVVEKILTMGDELQLKSVLLLNNWWHERNNVREGGRRRSAEEITSLCGRQTSELKSLKESFVGNADRQPCRKKWEKPPPGSLKLNVDGAFSESDKNGGWGYVIRNEDGEVIQSGSGRVTPGLDPMHMELAACIEGVRAAMALGITNLIMETDAMQVVWAVQGDDFRLAAVGGLVHVLKEMLVDNFANCSIKYIPRECNRVAHELAAIGSRSSVHEPSVLPGVPFCMMVLVSSDLADMVE